MNEVIEVIGDTTPPEGCEAAQVRIIKNKREPIEVVLGCIDFKLAPSEAYELAILLSDAATRFSPNPLDKKRSTT